MDAMTMLDKFLSFARRLPADRLASVKERLSEGNDLTSEEMTEIDRRVARTDPEFSNQGVIAKIFGQSFAAR